MSNNSKPFDRGLYEQHDQPAKQIAAEVFGQIYGFTLSTPIEQQPEVYKKWDFVMEKDGTSIPIECERLACWTCSGFFPYPEAHFLGRKEQSESKVFFQVNATGDTAVWLPTGWAKSCPKKRVNTTYTEAEPMRIIPTTMLRIATKNDGKWKLLQLGKNETTLN
jgi:hypothetical protein